MSKFITNSRLKGQSSELWSNHLPKGYWRSSPISAQEKEEQKKHEEAKNFRLKEKERLEAIPLEKLSFTDLYQLPFHQAKYGTWVYDALSHFIFQFQISNEKTRKEAVDILNGNLIPKQQNKFVHKDGMIYLDRDGELHEFILIRGWGGLTGIGGYNLSGEYASKIQDTLAEFIIEKLNNNERNF